jgi:enamine deaminase RidA (YjgF/YER057c/UK114 family)
MSTIDRQARARGEHEVTVERHSPGGRTAEPGYAEVAITTGVRFAFVAGQCPLDDDGHLVGPGDVVAQTQQVVENLRTCLVDLGAGSDQIVRTTVYVVGDQDALATAWAAFRESQISGTPMAPSTLLGVERLGYDGQLVEIDAIVLLD